MEITNGWKELMWWLLKRSKKKIYEKKKFKTHKQKMKEELRRKLYNDYNTKRIKYKTKKELFL